MANNDLQVSVIFADPNKEHKQETTPEILEEMRNEDYTSGASADCIGGDWIDSDHFDGYIKRLAAAYKYDCEQHKSEIDKRDKLISELVKALETTPVCGADCAKCKSRDVCRFYKERELIARAKEHLNA